LIYLFFSFFSFIDPLGGDTGERVSAALVALLLDYSRGVSASSFSFSPLGGEQGLSRTRGAAARLPRGVLPEDGVFSWGERRGMIEEGWAGRSERS
jgi:hypothetical protein